MKSKPILCLALALGGYAFGFARCSFGAAANVSPAAENILRRVSDYYQNLNEAYRDPAIYALSFNRTDASVNALKSLLNNTNEEIRFMAKEAIREAYSRGGHSKGRPFRPEDFEMKFQKPANISGQVETNSSGN